MTGRGFEENYPASTTGGKHMAVGGVNTVEGDTVDWFLCMFVDAVCKTELEPR